MIDKTFEEIEESVTLRDIEENTRKPPPYTMPFRKSVTAVSAHLKSCFGDTQSASERNLPFAWQFLDSLSGTQTMHYLICQSKISLRSFCQDWLNLNPPFTSCLKQSVHMQAKLNDIKVAVEMACDAKAGSKQRLDVRSARDIMQNEDNLRQVLAPFLHSQRQTSTFSLNKVLHCRGLSSF